MEVVDTVEVVDIVEAVDIFASFIVKVYHIQVVFFFFFKKIKKKLEYGTAKEEGREPAPKFEGTYLYRYPI